MKDDGNRNQQRGDGIAREPIECSEVEKCAGEDGKKRDQENPAQEGYRAGAAYQIEQPQENERNEENVNETRYVQPGEEVLLIQETTISFRTQ